MSQIESHTVPLDAATFDGILARLRQHDGFRAESNDGDQVSLRRERLPPIDAYLPKPDRDVNVDHTTSLEAALALFEALSQGPHAHERAVFAHHRLWPGGRRPPPDEADATVFQARRRGVYELGCSLGSASPLAGDPRALQAFFEGLFDVLGWAESLPVGRDTEGRSVLLTGDDRFVQMLPDQWPSGDEQDAALAAGRVLVSVRGVAYRDELGARPRDFHSFTARGVPASEFDAKLAAVLDYVGREPAGASSVGLHVRPEAYDRLRESVDALGPPPSGWEATFWSGRALSVEVVVGDPAIEGTSFPWGRIRRGRRAPVDIDVEFDRSRERPFRLWFATRDAEVVLEDLAGALVGDPALIDLEVF